MPTRVVNVRRLLRTGGKATERFGAVYVGRTMPGLFKAHPLADPFRVAHTATHAERLACLERYAAWLAALPERDEHLRRLARQVQRTGMPLGCWCGDWPEDPELICHAVLLAKEVDRVLASAKA